MSDSRKGFERGWITAGHSSLWNCDSTYCYVPCELLPAVDAAGDLRWLKDVSPQLANTISDTCTLGSADNEIQNLEAIAAEAGARGLKLPDSFLRFMGSPDLQRLVPSCTACYLELSDELTPLPEAEGDFLLRFMNDSQACCLWYLWLRQGETPRVLAARYFFEPDIFAAMACDGVEYDDAVRGALLCADSFPDFLYRFWIENTIWYSLHDRMALTPRQQEYRDRITERL